MSTVTRRPWTADELVRLPAGWRYEIDDGELIIMAPAGFRHGRLTNRIAHRITGFAESTGAGEVGAGEVGVVLSREPREILRAVDVAFYSAERMQRLADQTGFVDVPPDLAVEVHDPSEPDLRRKVAQYLRAGVRSVWVVGAVARTLTQHRPGEEPRTVADPDAVVEEPVLPGFSCRLRDLLGEG